MSDGEECEPRKKHPKKRCAYVRSLPSCAKDDNLLHYLEIHYCTMGNMPFVSAITQLSLIGLFCFILVRRRRRRTTTTTTRVVSTYSFVYPYDLRVHLRACHVFTYQRRSTELYTRFTRSDMSGGGER